MTGNCLEFLGKDYPIKIGPLGLSGVFLLLLIGDLGTEGRNRTDTPVKEPDFESGASTSSATPARKRRDYSSELVHCTALNQQVY